MGPITSNKLFDFGEQLMRGSTPQEIFTRIRRQFLDLSAKFVHLSLYRTKVYSAFHPSGVGK